LTYAKSLNILQAKASDYKAKGFILGSSYEE
jgi:hypothetical protein